MAKRGKINQRQRILEEAAKLFKSKGFAGTSMRDLGGEVGMEAASIYNHVKSKDEILESICFYISDTYISQLAEVERTATPYREKIETLIRQHIRLMLEEGAVPRRCARAGT